MNSTLSSYIYKFSERILTHATTFIVSIVLARLLTPSDYGTLSIILVFVTLAQVVIEGGLSSALIQNKDVKDRDYDTILTITLILSLAIYSVIVLFANSFERWLAMPGVGSAFIVIALVLFPSSYLSVIKARLVRTMNFKLQMIVTFVSSLVSGVVGIFCAYSGFGIWALIIQQLSNTILLVLLFSILLKWIPKLKLNLDWARARVLYNYGWKIMCTNLLVRGNTELVSLAFGKQFSSASLGVYDRGKQFPQAAAENIESTIQSVLFSILSKCQTDINMVRQKARNMQVLCSYILFFILALIGASAPTYIPLLLTDKWNGCIPFLVLWVVCYLTSTYTIIATTAINSVGHSNLTLKRQLLTTIPSFIVTIMVVFNTSSPLSVMTTKVVLIPYTFLITAYYLKKSIQYKLKDQVTDLLPNLILGFVVYIIIYLMNNIQINRMLLLLIQGISALFFYVAISAIFKMSGFKHLQQVFTKSSH